MNHSKMTTFSSIYFSVYVMNDEHLIQYMFLSLFLRRTHIYVKCHLY